MRWVGIEGVRKMDGIENRKYRLVKKIFLMHFLLFCTRFRLVARSSELILRELISDFQNVIIGGF